MIALERTVAVLLCAGLSRRFGEDDKLIAPLRDKPLVLHAAEMLARQPFGHRIAVVPHGAGALHRLLAELGFTLVANDRPEAGQDISVRLGLAGAAGVAPDAVLLALGDMPNITGDHLARLAALADKRTIAISAADDWRAPPMLIPTARARQILDRPQRAVKELVAAGATVELRVAAAMLRDLDTPADFAAAAD